MAEAVSLRGILLSPTKIKSEIEYDSEYEVLCRLCDKAFASNMALQNHARVFHMDAFETGDPNVWTRDSEENLLVPRITSKPVKVKREFDIRTQAVVSAMKPTSITSLASQHVSYIIIKTEDLPEDHPEAKKRKRVRKREDVVRVKRNEGRKSPEVISGPFECLESSLQGADGTCHQMFFSCCEYSAHQLSEHAKLRRRAPRCQVCERPLSQLNQEPKEFSCDHCSEGFDEAEALKEHKTRFHERIKSYPCEICHKYFYTQGGLVQHMRSHTGDRPYSCTYCEKAFTQKSGLEQHIRTHTKEKPFRCVVCSKSFIQTIHLKQHMRTHTNVAPFQCVVCEKRFKQSSHLNYHLKHHHETIEHQQDKYKEIMSRLRNAQVDRSESDPETVMAEQSILEEGSYEVQETYAFVDGEGEERVITCEVPQYDS